MNKKILIGSIIAVALLTLVSFSSVVGYSSVKNTQEGIITDEYDSYTPIQLVFQLISELRYNKEIQQLVVDDEVDIQDEIVSIIESDEELNSIVEKLSDLNCGCNPDNSEFIDEDFFIICLILFAIMFLWIWVDLVIGLPMNLMVTITIYLAVLFNCSWIPPYDI